MIAVVTAAGRDPEGGELGAAICAALAGRGYSVVGWDGLGELEATPELVVNVLFDHASAPRRAAFAEMAPSEVESEIATTLVGCAVVCLAAVRRMKVAGRGAIVNVTSAIASYPAPGRLAEGAAAAGIESLTASLGAELGATGIRVNAVAPAPALSDGPRATDEEVAALVAFVGSPEAAALNGTVVRADPGFDPFPGLR